MELVKVYDVNALCPQESHAVCQIYCSCYCEVKIYLYSIAKSYVCIVCKSLWRVMSSLTALLKPVSRYRLHNPRPFSVAQIRSFFVTDSSKYDVILLMRSQFLTKRDIELSVCISLLPSPYDSMRPN